MRKFQIFNVFHHKLFDEMYASSPEMLNNLTFFAVNEQYTKEWNKDKNYNIINEWDLKHYKPEMQQKGYCQTSALYHIHKNELDAPYNFVGCMQYDMKVKDQAVTKIQSILEKHSEPVFYIMKGNHSMHCKGLFTPYPNTDKSVLSHYNNFFNKNYTYDYLQQHKILDNFILLHTFLISKYMFRDMMAWIEQYLIEFEQYYNAKACNMDNASFLERVHSLYLAIAIHERNLPMFELPLEHIWPLYHNKVDWHNYKTL